MNTKKQNIILTIIAIVVLLLAVIGATFAFFASQNTGKKDVNINAESGTTDVLSFNLEDKDIASETIVDEDNDNTEITIKANMSNFNEESINVGDGVIGKAILLANDATKSASDNYYVYLNITKNELDYSTVGGKAELILQVKKIDKSKPLEEQEEVITQIDGLDYISSEDPKYENTEGFDITKKRGLIKISQSDIETSDEIKDQGRENLSNMTTHEWEIKIILVNLKENQNENTNKTFTGTIMMQKEEYVPEYQKTINKLLELANKESEEPTLIKHNTEELNRKYSDMANKELNANDDSYRFSGSNEVVNNYICFGGECSSNPDDKGYKYLYRIIGFFQNDNGEYEMKIIKADVATKEDLGDSTAENSAYYGNYDYDKTNYKGKKYDDLAGYYWNSTDSKHLEEETNTNANMWKFSNLNTKNLNEIYYDALDLAYQKMVVKHEWQVGAVWNTGDAKAVYDYELGSNKLTENSKNCYNQDGKVIDNLSEARLCNQNNDLNYSAFVGMMYISDYMYGTLPKYWNTVSGSYSDEGVKTNNWLYLGISEWAISRHSVNGYGARYVNSAGYTSAYVLYVGYCVRPVVYLSSGVKITGGSGSMRDPYQLAV